MTHRAVDLPLFWSAAQAATVLDYLDRLRDLIWESYAEEIIELRLSERDDEAEARDDQCRFEFEFGRDRTDYE